MSGGRRARPGRAALRLGRRLARRARRHAARLQLPHPQPAAAALQGRVDRRGAPRAARSTSTRPRGGPRYALDYPLDELLVPAPARARRRPRGARLRRRVARTRARVLRPVGRRQVHDGAAVAASREARAAAVRRPLVLRPAPPLGARLRHAVARRRRLRVGRAAHRSARSSSCATAGPRDLVPLRAARPRPGSSRAASRRPGTARAWHARSTPARTLRRSCRRSSSRSAPTARRSSPCARRCRRSRLRPEARGAILSASARMSKPAMNESARRVYSTRRLKHRAGAAHARLPADRDRHLAADLPVPALQRDGAAAAVGREGAPAGARLRAAAGAAAGHAAHRRAAREGAERPALRGAPAADRARAVRGLGSRRHALPAARCRTGPTSRSWSRSRPTSRRSRACATSATARSAACSTRRSSPSSSPTSTTRTARNAAACATRSCRTIW